MSDLFRDKIAKLKDRISELEAESEKRLAQSQARESHYLLRIEELEHMLTHALRREETLRETNERLRAALTTIRDDANLCEGEGYYADVADKALKGGESNENERSDR